MKIIVYHSEYGCDTGCCGHMIKSEDPSDSSFTFNHPFGEDPKAFAENLIREYLGEEHVKDLDWENCVISDG